MTTPPPTTGPGIRRRPRSCQLNITIQVDLVDRLDEYAAARAISRAEAMRTLLSYALDNRPSDQLPGQLPLGGAT